MRFFGSKVLALENLRGNACRFCLGKAARFCLVGKDRYDFRRKPGACAARISASMLEPPPEIKMTTRLRFIVRAGPCR